MKKKPNRTLVSSLFINILCVATLALSASLPGGGWWFGAQVQNVSSTTASVTYTIYDFASATYSRSDNINPGTSRNYGLSDFNLADNFQGSSKANSAQDIRAIVNLTNRGITVNGTVFGDYDSPSPAAGQYQGMEAGASTLRFPLVKIDHYHKSTTIIVQNAGTGSATATASFTFGSTIYTYFTPTIGPGKMAVIEPIDARNGNNHPPTSSVGSLTVTSTQPLTGIALEHLTGELHATVLQATRGFTDSDANAHLYAPINKNNSYNRFTGLQVQNADTHNVNITVGYYPTCQSGKIVGVVNESFTPDYLNSHPDHAQEATSYAAIPRDPFISRHILSVPLFKEDSYSKTTGVSVQNIGSSTASVVATFKNNNQTFVTNAMNIDSGKAIVLQDMRLLVSNPPSWWRGWDTSGGKLAMNPTTLGCNANGCGANGVFSLILNSTNNYSIVAVANETTYPIQTPRINQDKSNYEAFSLTSVP